MNHIFLVPLFVLSVESTKFGSIRKPCTYNSVCDTVLAVRKFIAYESSRALEYEIFTRTKISAITVYRRLHECTKEATARSKVISSNHSSSGLASASKVMARRVTVRCGSAMTHTEVYIHLKDFGSSGDLLNG